MIIFPKGWDYDPKTGRVSGIPGSIYPFDGVDIELAPPSVLLVGSSASKRDVKDAIERIKVKGRKGKRRDDQSLKELGAKRLFMQTRSWEVACDHARSHRTPNGIAPAYGNESQWRRAKSRALKRIAEVMQHLL
jgi:hypothetical protein